MSEVGHQTIELFQKEFSTVSTKTGKLFIASAYVIISFALCKQRLKDSDDIDIIIVFWILSIAAFFI